MTMKVELVRKGMCVQSSSVRGGEVAQIKTRRSLMDLLTGRSEQISIFGDGNSYNDISGQVHRFAKDGTTALVLGCDALGQKIPSHYIKRGYELSFNPRAGVDVRILFEAGKGEPPNPPAEVYDKLGPVKFGDMIKVVAECP